MYTTEIYETIGLDNGLSPGGRQAIIWTNSNESSTAPRRMTFNSNFVLKKSRYFCSRKFLLMVIVHITIHIVGE